MIKWSNSHLIRSRITAGDQVEQDHVKAEGWTSTLVIAFTSRMFMFSVVFFTVVPMCQEEKGMSTFLICVSLVVGDTHTHTQYNKWSCGTAGPFISSFPNSFLQACEVGDAVFVLRRLKQSSVLWINPKSTLPFCRMIRCVFFYIPWVWVVFLWWFTEITLPTLSTKCTEHHV